VISMAGKRNKRVALAKANAQFSEYEFNELMRTLKTELHNYFYTIYFNEITLSKYNVQLDLLSRIISALQTQSDKGNIPLNEVLRIKALYYQFNNERSDLVSDLLKAQRELATLLQVTQTINTTPTQGELAKYKTVGLDQTLLVSKAIENRPDLKMVDNLSEQARLNMVLQKRIIYPDLHIGAVYDQAGSYVNNYSAITLGLDLPIWNRNQGTVKYAKAISDQYKVEVKNKQISVTNEVLAAYRKLMLIEQEYGKVDADFSNQFELLNEGFISNFQKRNISLIEFTDFIEAYNNSIQQLNNLKEKRIEAYEELNYVIGEELFH
jgi:outer membrane protein, heavy metal efflux system